MQPAGGAGDEADGAVEGIGRIVAVSGVGAMLAPFALGQIGQMWSVALAVRLGWLLTAATLLSVTLIPHRKRGNPAPPPNV